jgi:hypothetical protein
MKNSYADDHEVREFRRKLRKTMVTDLFNRHADIVLAHPPLLSPLLADTGIAHVVSSASLVHVDVHTQLPHLRSN